MSIEQLKNTAGVIVSLKQVQPNYQTAIANLRRGKDLLLQLYDEQAANLQAIDEQFGTTFAADAKARADELRNLDVDAMEQTLAELGKALQAIE
jgi:Arc/MetJ-type ribon-helix-helix transcriptional regulator